jgi:hypothetical protein
MTVRLLRPDGDVVQPAYHLAPGRPVLASARIGVLDNLKPNAGLLMTTVAEQLAARAGSPTPLVLTKGAAGPAPDEHYARLREEIDLAITGSAD